MKLQYHFLISFLVGSVYLFLTDTSINLSSLLPWLIGGVLVDIDHFFTYVKRNKTLNFKKIARLIIDDYHLNNQHIYIFHTIEFILFFSLMVARTSLNWPYLASYLLHLACDGIRLNKLTKSYDWLKKWSLAYYFKNHN
jgi:hypothetical protein